MGHHDDLGLTGTPAEDVPDGDAPAAASEETVSAAAVAVRTARRRCRTDRAAYRDALVAAGRSELTPQRWAQLMALRAAAAADPTAPRREVR